MASVAEALNFYFYSILVNFCLSLATCRHSGGHLRIVVPVLPAHRGKDAAPGAKMKVMRPAV